MLLLLFLLTAGAGGALLTLAMQQLAGCVAEKRVDGLIGRGGEEKLHKLVPPREDIRNGIEECIGNTPLVRVKSLSNARDATRRAKQRHVSIVRIYTRGTPLVAYFRQAEQGIGFGQFLEPGGFTKDRIALNMINIVHTLLCIPSSSIGSLEIALPH